jgi:hypothetical protein
LRRRDGDSYNAGMSLNQERIRIDATASVVWDVLMDVARWPEWTASIDALEPQAPGLLAVGSVARLKQPGYRAAMWRVTQMDAGRSFTWETQAFPGVRAIAVHDIAPDGDATVVTLTVETTGPLAFLAAPMITRASRRFLPMEAQGLKARSEERARSR